MAAGILVDREIADFYKHMPKQWVFWLETEDYLPPQLIKGVYLEDYLKDLGFTGVPYYTCKWCHFKCQLGFRWKDVSDKKKLKCINCGIGRLIQSAN